MGMKKLPKTRDYAMVALIKGATKGGPHRTRKPKETRECRECYHDYEPTNNMDDGFCSDFCAEKYDKELYGSKEEE